MPALPIPPASYWDTVPWWGFLGIILVMGALCSPFAVQWARNRSGSFASRETAFASQQNSFEQRRTAFLASIEADRDAARAALDRERAAFTKRLTELEADRDEGWDLGRGMEDKAHEHRHLAASVILRFRGLLRLCHRLIAGELTTTAFGALVSEVAADPPENPPRVPPLREVGRKRHSDHPSTRSTP